MVNLKYVKYNIKEKYMNTEILLVRHGETEWNATGKFQGSKDISLSQEGLMQAKFLKERLHSKYDCIYTSPLIRAKQTAELICENTPMVPIIEIDLREINFGAWEGLTLHQISTQYVSEFNSWKTDEMNGYLVGGDLSLKNASIRAKNAILRIAKECIGKKVIIIAHGGIIKAGLIGILDWKMNKYHEISLGNTAVSKLIFDEALNATLVTLNDTSHLPADYKLKSFV
jgi:probable phosphoglycerate mutase